MDLLPRLAPSVISRPRLAEWFKQYADFPLRLVVGPAGYGKTTALAAYARSGFRRMSYLLLDESTTPQEIARSIAQAAGIAVLDACADIRAALAEAAPTDIVLDDAHRASGALREFVNRLIVDAPPGLNVVIGAQRRDVLDDKTLLARGFIPVCDQSDLAFDRDEIRELLDAHGIRASASAIRRLEEQTDGWPFLVSGVVRHASITNVGIDLAFESCKRQWREPMRELVLSMLDRVTPAERDAVCDYLATGSTIDQQTFAALHRAGFFVRFNDAAFTLMRSLSELCAPPQSQTDATPCPLLSVRMFGRFEAEIGGRPIVWARRRDQQLFKYLLLAPNGSATRGELTDTFWPDVPRQAALQNLRTACCTIRRAIANVVGDDRIDDYLLVGERLTLNTSLVVFDVDRFRRHAAAGDAAFGSGRFNDAVAHYRAAERLFGNGFLVGDVGDPAFDAHAQTCRRTYTHIVNRLSSSLLERQQNALHRAGAAFGIFDDDERASQLLRLAVS